MSGGGLKTGSVSNDDGREVGWWMRRRQAGAAYISVLPASGAGREVGATRSTKGLSAARTMAAAIPKGKCTGGRKWKPGAMYSNFSVPSRANGERGGGARPSGIAAFLLLWVLTPHLHSPSLSPQPSRGTHHSRLFAPLPSPQSTCLHQGDGRACLPITRHHALALPCLAYLSSAGLMGITGWDPSVCKSNRLHVHPLVFHY